MTTLAVNSTARAYGDLRPSSNPLRRGFDITRSIQATVGKAHTEPAEIEPGGSRTIFDTTRATTLDGTTAFTITGAAPTDPSRYRFTWISGTDPTLRTDRGLSLSGSLVTVAQNPDQTITITLGSGTFGATIAGDTVFLPGPTTGDAATVFSPLNQGFWVVLAVLTASSLQLQRPTGTTFSAASEAVTLSSAAQLQAFSAAGVQAGDRVAISAAFADATRRTFTIDRVTSKWFEAISTSPVAQESNKAPGASGMIFYSGARIFIRVEADQEAVARFNGDTSDVNWISPWQAGDPEQIGWSERTGPAWKLVLVNKSSQILAAETYSVEG